MKIPIVVQHRHVHLSSRDRETLFGKEPLVEARAIGQKGQVVYQKTVQVVGPNGKFEHVCVLGPDRDQTQVELSSSDAFALGLKASVRVSGDLERSASCKLVGPSGDLDAKSTTIIPVRHLHCTPQFADQNNLKHHDVASLSIDAFKEKTISDVVVRVHPTYSIEFHLTKDEAAEHWIQSGDTAQIV